MIERCAEPLYTLPGMTDSNGSDWSRRVEEAWAIVTEDRRRTAALAPSSCGLELITTSGCRFM